MNQIKAEVICDSKNKQGDRITTFIVEFPRMILAELNTHRMFSRNSASSRALPFKKMVKMVEENPFIPIAWQKDHKGMQGTEYISDVNILKEDWILSSKSAIQNAIDFNEAGVTKQLCNRLLEPFMMHKVLITATEFENFFKLRCSQYEYVKKNGEKVYFRSKKEYSESLDTSSISGLDWLKINKGQGEIHIMDLAEKMWDAINESTPKELKEGESHIPFGNNIDTEMICEVLDESGGDPDKYHELDSDDIDEIKIKIATARCARTSYNNFDGSSDYEKDIKLYDNLLEMSHMSPFEHVSKCMSGEEYSQYQKVTPCMGGETWEEFGWCRNFRGFIQLRELLEDKNK